MTDSNAILDYWFESIPEQQPYSPGRLSFWFLSDPDDPARGADRFEPLMERALDGALSDWEGSHRGALALLLLLGQLRRSGYPGQAAAYAGDELARRLAMRCHFEGRDRLLKPIERVFMYMPLIDSENLEAHRRGLDAFSHLYQSVPDAWQTSFAPFLDEALRRFDAIERFGRFPERNAVLGRLTLPGEQVYLDRLSKGAGEAPLNPRGAV